MDRKILWRRVLCLAAATMLTFPAAAGAQTIWTANPSADAFVTTGPDGTLSASNYGGAGALMVAAPGLPDGEFQSVLQFDVSGATALFDTTYGVGQWSITTVSLTLTATSPNNPIFNALSDGDFSIVWMENDSWTEGSGTPNSPGASGVTFDSLPSFASANDTSQGTFHRTTAPSGATTWTLTTTPEVLNDIAAGGAVSFRIVAADTDVSYLFNSRSFGTASRRPVLSISAVPEPSAAMLVILGMLGLAGRRRRREK